MGSLNKMIEATTPVKKLPKKPLYADGDILFFGQYYQPLSGDNFWMVDQIHCNNRTTDVGLMNLVTDEIRVVSLTNLQQRTNQQLEEVTLHRVCAVEIENGKCVFYGYTCTD